MGIDVAARLAALGVELPEVNPPKGAYIPAVVSGRHVFVAGQVPMRDGELIATGKVGGEVSVDQARALARVCALSALAAAGSAVPLDRVSRVVKVVGFVASAEGFTGQPGVVDGASDLFVDVFGDAGRHARSSVGVAELPLGAPVEVEVVLEIEPDAASFGLPAV